MSKSTTGAYGDYPDYYYKRGNQFSTYLGGSAPPETWDQRMEKTLVADTGPLVRPKPSGSRAPRPPAKPRTPARVLTSPVLSFARANLTSRDIRDLAAALASARGLDVARLVARDPVAALATGLAVLTPKEEQHLLERLRQDFTSSPPKPEQRARRSAQVSGAPRTPRERKPPKAQAPSHCVVCSVALSSDDVGFSSANRAAFFDHGYCRSCGGKMLVVLGVA